MNRRNILWQAAAALLAGSVLSAAAQDRYPNQPIRMVVPWPAGGLVDVAARQVGTRLEAALGQPVVVENRVGAGGAIGADAVAKAAPNGHMLLFTTSALTMNAALKTNLPFELKDLQPLAVVGHAPSVLVVGPAIQPQSVRDLIALARSEPGKLSYASAGVGSPAHLTGELFKSKAKLFVVHVPYTGAPAAINDQLAGRIDFQFANAAVALPQIRAGKVRPLAVTGASRFDALPDVPTMVEAGVPDFEADQWLGLLAPSGIPQAVADRLNAEVNRILADQEFRAALGRAGIAAAAPVSSQQFSRSVQQEHAKWTDVIRTQGIKAQ